MKLTYLQHALACVLNLFFTSCLVANGFQFQSFGRVCSGGSLTNSVSKSQSFAVKFGIMTPFLEKNQFARQVGVASSSLQENEVVTMEFTTPEMLVYIEDTDSYGVMYNSNYVRAYDRALHMISISDRGGNDGVAKSVLDHEGWSLVRVTNQKFKSSPPLGGSFVVAGKLTSGTDVSEVWDLEMKQSRADNEAVVYNTARVTIARPDLTSSCIPKPEPLEEEATKTVEYKFMLYRDEFDTHLPTHLPLRNVLNLFERSRTNFVGGPESLRRMQQDGLLWVVTGTEECSLVNLGTDNEDKEAIEASPGQIVIVRTSFLPKRRGMILECRHTLLLTDQSGGKRRLAQGIVNLIAIDDKTRRPTSDIPEWVRDAMYSKE